MIMNKNFILTKAALVKLLDGGFIPRDADPGPWGVDRSSYPRSAVVDLAQY
jgi:hypothetical protein